jgi:hypothetical protein
MLARLPMCRRASTACALSRRRWCRKRSRRERRVCGETSCYPAAWWPRESGTRPNCSRASGSSARGVQGAQLLGMGEMRRAQRWRKLGWNVELPLFALRAHLCLNRLPSVFRILVSDFCLCVSRFRNPAPGRFGRRHARLAHRLRPLRQEARAYPVWL